MRKTPAAGEQVISRRSQSRDDRYYEGQVVRITDESGSFVVVSEWKQAPNEDNGDYDWMCCAIVRAATVEESAQRAGEIRRAEAPRTVVTHVVLAIKAGERIAENEAGAALRGESAPTLTLDMTPWRVDIDRIAVHGEHVVGYHGGYYDDYRASAWRAPATELLVAALRALASGDAEALAAAADTASKVTSCAIDKVDS